MYLHVKVLKFSSTSGFCSLCQLWAAVATLLLLPLQHVQCRAHLQHTDTSMETLTDFSQRCTHTCSNKNRDQLVDNTKAIVTTGFALLLNSWLSVQKATAYG